MTPLSHDDVCRELRELLTAEPSPTFVPRVRASIAARPTRSREVIVAAACLSAVAAAVFIAVAVKFTIHAGDLGATSTLHRLDATSSITHTPEVRITSQAPSPARRIRIPLTSATKTQRTLRELRVPVLVSTDDIHAFDRLVRSTKDGTVALSFEDTNREQAMAELIIPPIIVKPLGASEEEGAVQ